MISSELEKILRKDYNYDVVKRSLNYYLDNNFVINIDLFFKKSTTPNFDYH